MPRRARTGSLLKGAYGYLAAFLLYLGEAASDILSTLQRQPARPPMNALQAADYLEQGKELLDVGKYFGRLPRSSRPNKSRIPIDPTIPRCFRYVVQVPFLDPAGTPQQPNTAFRTAVIDTDQLLSRSDLLEAAQRWAQGLVGDMRYEIFTEQGYNPDFIAEPIVTAITRNC